MDLKFPNLKPFWNKLNWVNKIIYFISVSLEVKTMHKVNSKTVYENIHMKIYLR